MSRIFIVRHGNTFAPGDPPRRIGARTDLPLVAAGVEQADGLGQWFATRGIAFDHALAAPLLRTRQTAHAILARADRAPALATAEWLAEIDHGPDEGELETAVEARVGADALAAWEDAAIPPPGWIVDLPARLAAWRGFFDAAPPGNILLVTSNGAARFALLARAGLKASWRGPLKLRTGAFGEIMSGNDGVLTLTAWDVRPGELV